MPKPRTPVPDDVSAEVMFQHDRTCCVCREPGLAVQIHHIDEDPTNHIIPNLAVLCLEHHEQTQTRGGFAKKLKAGDVVRYRDDWVRRVAGRRDKADELVIKHAAGILPTKVTIEDWSEPSEAKVTGFLDALPSIRRAAIAAARPLWNTGVTSEMRRGNYDAIEFLERAWLQLAKFYPPHHFGEMTADHFLSQFIAQRFAWHRKLYEPRGPGSSGTRVHVLAGGAVLDDVANAIAETVEGLFVGYCLHDFDLTKWRSDWNSAGQLDDEAKQMAAEKAGPVPKLVEALGAVEVESKRASLQLSSPQVFPDYGAEKWLAKIANLGPATARAVRMQLRDFDPAPKCDSSLTGRCPLKVIIPGSNAPVLDLAKGQIDKFQLFRVHPGGPVVPVSDIDTDLGRDITIQIGERWCLHYRVYAENANDIDLKVIMLRNKDGSVTVQRDDDSAH